MFSRTVSHGKQRIGLEHHAAVRARARDLAPVQNDAPGGRPVEPGDDAQQRGFPAARGTEDRDEVVVADLEIGRFERLGRRMAVARREGSRNLIDPELGHASFHGNSQALNALNRKSEMRPMSPMTMMPKMIWPVLSRAWLSVIMCPIPDDDPINSATMT